MRRARFAIALSLAAVLGGWLVWTSIGGSLETYSSPAGLQRTDGTTYRLNGLVAAGAPVDAAERAQGPDGLRFTVVDKKDAESRVTVVYRGSVPDTFQSGREVVVTGHMRDGVFEARRGSLVTLCPSKFKAKPGEEQQHPANVPKTPVTPT
ncbi:MAG: cytochrome c maturation protein CcmE [Thermoleophilia bacterium]|jgi:cytochrome c-type biogenesis protein CcmE|nr:cytochrome c maturation protein CcmE [Thermoleophilia bacterium]